MDIKKKIIAGVLFLIVSIGLFRAGMAAGAAAAKPGSSGDPLITQGYLEKRLLEVSGASYKKISLTKGKTLTGGVGTEFFLYSGSAAVSGSKGLINLTDGQMFKNGNAITLYSQFFVQDASSGVKASSDCVIFVKGSYTIK